MERRDHLHDETLAFRLQFEEIAGVYKAFEDRKRRNGRFDLYSHSQLNAAVDPHQAYLEAKMYPQQTYFYNHARDLAEQKVPLQPYQGQQRRSMRSDSMTLSWNANKWNSSTQQHSLHDLVGACSSTTSNNSPSDLSSDRERSPSGSSSSTAPPVSPPFNQTVFARSPLSPSKFKFDPFSHNGNKIEHEEDEWHDIISETRNMSLNCEVDH